MLRQAALHIGGGAKKVIISAPPKDQKIGEPSEELLSLNGEL